MKINPVTTTLWLLRLVAVVLMAQTLYFKFTAAEESVYIFSTLGIEPWGRIGTGIAELCTAILLLVPSTIALGALLSIGIMSGAIASHIAVLGIVVKNDGGQLFIYALIVLIASAIVAYAYKHQIAQYLHNYKQYLPKFLRFSKI